jgi:hypothetical protein
MKILKTKKNDKKGEQVSKWSLKFFLFYFELNFYSYPYPSVNFFYLAILVISFGTWVRSFSWVRQQNENFEKNPILS